MKRSLDISYTNKSLCDRRKEFWHILCIVTVFIVVIIIIFTYFVGTSEKSVPNNSINNTYVHENITHITTPLLRSSQNFETYINTTNIFPSFLLRRRTNS